MREKRKLRSPATTTSFQPVAVAGEAGGGGPPAERGDESEVRHHLHRRCELQVAVREAEDEAREALPVHAERDAVQERMDLALVGDGKEVVHVAPSMRPPGAIRETPGPRPLVPGCGPPSTLLLWLIPARPERFERRPFHDHLVRTTSHGVIS